jgi:hypothetical protein
VVRSLLTNATDETGAYVHPQQCQPPVHSSHQLRTKRTDAAKSAWMTTSTFGKSTPRAAESVHTRTRCPVLASGGACHQ